MSVMKPEDVEVKQLYERFARFPAFLYLDALFGYYYILATHKPA